MKTERRHDLETNSLALKMTQWIETIKPHINKLLGAVAVIVGLMAINSIWNSKSAANEQNAWDAFAQARTSTDPELMSVQKLAESEEFAGTRMREWAQIVWADRQVLLSARTYLFDRKAALSRLRGVIGIYDGLTTSASDPELRDRAHFGLGRVYELQNKVNLAQQQFAKVQGDLGPIASQRAEQLQSGGVKDDCEWLATAELPKRDLTGGQGASGQKPSFNATIPKTSATDSAAEQVGLEDLLENFSGDEKVEDRYEEESTESQESQPADESDSAAE